MHALRVAILAAFFYLPHLAEGQHQALHWYAFQSIVPLNAEEGKEALIIIRELTTDSISGFSNKNDYFTLASKESENLDNLADQLNAAGFYLIDVTHPRLENQYFVRATKGFQFAILFCNEPDRFSELDPQPIIITPTIRQLLSSEQRLQIESNNKFILKEN